MKKVFADSFCCFAYVNSRDQAHARTVAALHAYRGRLVTTAWVLTELGDGLIQRANRPVFLRTVDALQANPNVTIVPCSEELFQAGIQFFRQRPDKEWPLTDCISFVVMEREGIAEAFTGDHHFEQAGFIAHLK